MNHFISFHSPVNSTSLTMMWFQKRLQRTRWHCNTAVHLWKKPRTQQGWCILHWLWESIWQRKLDGNFKWYWRGLERSEAHNEFIQWAISLRQNWWKFVRILYDQQRSTTRLHTFALAIQSLWYSHYIKHLYCVHYWKNTSALQDIK